jgi:hypothetical protein
MVALVMLAVTAAQAAQAELEAQVLLSVTAALAALAALVAAYVLGVLLQLTVPAVLVQQVEATSVSLATQAVAQVLV